MTFAAVGSFQQASTGSPASSLNISLNNQGIGDLLLIAVRSVSTTVLPSGISGGGATWSQMGTTFTGTTNAESFAIFAGNVTATGAHTATISVSGGTANIRADGQEFSSTVGSWALDVQGHLDGAGTNTWPSLTPAGAGELYFGSSQDSTVAVAGSTSGYTYKVDANSNGTAWNAACTSSAQAPVWGDAGHIFGIMMLVKETSTVPGTAALTAQGTLTAAAEQEATAAVAGAGVLTAGATLGTGVTLTATSSISAAATQGSGSSMTASGVVSVDAIQGAIATLTAAGAVSASDIQGAGAGLTGSSAVTVDAIQGAVATLAGLGTLSVPATQLATAILTGLGVVNASSGGATPGVASLTGQSSLSAPAIQEAGLALAGAGAVTVAGRQGGGVVLAGVSGLTVAGIQEAGMLVEGAGLLLVAAVQDSAAALAAVSAVTMAAEQGSEINLAAAGMVMVGAILESGAMLHGQGILTASGAGPSRRTGAGFLVFFP